MPQPEWLTEQIAMRDKIVRLLIQVPEPIRMELATLIRMLEESAMNQFDRLLDLFEAQSQSLSKTQAHRDTLLVSVARRN